MRKYGKLLLVLAVLTAVPAAASADTLLGGLLQKTSAKAQAAPQETNQQKAEQVKAALQKARIKGKGINIVVVDGVVTLSGDVTEPGHRARAGKVCEQISGVTRVDNKLRYLPMEANRQSRTLLGAVKAAGMQPKPVAAAAVDRRVQQVKAELPVVPGNQQVAQQIGAALQQAGLGGTGVGIHFQNGVARLEGSVPSEGLRLAAESAASQVTGVNSVRNELTVSSPAPTAAPQIAAAPVSHGQPVADPRFAPPVPHPAQMPGPYPAPMTMPTNYQMAAPAGPMTQVSAGAPVAMGGAGMFSHPQLPSHAWPSYAQYPNSAAVSYPTQYSASAFPYIGPFYPYPQVPLGWREAKLEWDDGYWQLNFNKKPNVWKTLFRLDDKD